MELGVVLGLRVFSLISWCSQSGDNPLKCLARTGYKLNAKVKRLKLLLYFWLATLIFPIFWSNYGYWKTIKPLYSSSFNFLIFHFGYYIYSQGKERLAGAWERNSLLRTEVGTFPAISTDGDRVPTVTAHTEMKEAPSARTNEEGVRTCWPVIEKRLGISKAWVRVLYNLPAGSISKTYPTKNLPGLVFKFWYLVNTLLARY
jgi:hypothetical protein